MRTIYESRGDFAMRKPGMSLKRVESKRIFFELESNKNVYAVSYPPIIIIILRGIVVQLET